MANIRGANKGKGNTTAAPRVGTAVSGGIRKVSRPSGYAGRTATSARGGLTDAALGSNNRGSGGKGAPGTGLSGATGGSTGGSSGGVIETTTNPGGGTTPTTPKPTSNPGTKPPVPSGVGDGSGSVITPPPSPDTLEGVFAAATPLSFTRQTAAVAPRVAAPVPATKVATTARAVSVPAGTRDIANPALGSPTTRRPVNLDKIPDAAKKPTGTTNTTLKSRRSQTTAKPKPGVTNTNLKSRRAQTTKAPAKAAPKSTATGHGGRLGRSSTSAAANSARAKAQAKARLAAAAKAKTRTASKTTDANRKRL